MSWSNASKNISSLTNQMKSIASLTWNQATFDWNDAGGTWSYPFDMANATKHTSSFSNQTKH